MFSPFPNTSSSQILQKLLPEDALCEPRIVICTPWTETWPMTQFVQERCRMLPQDVIPEFKSPRFDSFRMDESYFAPGTVVAQTKRDNQQTQSFLDQLDITSQQFPVLTIIIIGKWQPSTHCSPC